MDDIYFAAICLNICKWKSNQYRSSVNQSNWKRVFFCTHSFRILSKFLSVIVHVASKNEKREGWNHMCWTVITNPFEKTFKKKHETKPVFFPCFLKKTLNDWNQKTLASMWNKRKMLNILLSFHHIKFTDVKKEIYFKILFNFFVKHFQTLSRHAHSGAPACSSSF